MKDNRTHLTLSLALALLFVPLTALDTRAQAKQPNIVVIWNNDIGYRNISPNNHGMFGLQDAEFGSQREGRHRLHRIQSPTEPPREARSVHQRQRAEPQQRHDEDRRARREGRLAEDRRGQATDCRNQDYATGQVGKNHPGESQ